MEKGSRFEMLKDPSRWRSQFKSLKPSIQWIVGLTGAGMIFLIIWGGFNPQNDSANGNTFAALGLDVFLKLGIVLILIYASAHLLRKFGITGISQKTRHLSISETLSLSPRRALYIIKVGEQKLLIGATDQNITLIKQLDDIPSGSKPISPSGLDFYIDQTPTVSLEE